METLEFAIKQEHIMDFTRLRALGSLFSMLKQAVRNVITYNQQHPDFPMEVRTNHVLTLQQLFPCQVKYCVVTQNKSNAVIKTGVYVLFRRVRVLFSAHCSSLGEY